MQGPNVGHVMNLELHNDAAWESTANAAVGNCPAPAVSVVISLYNYSNYIQGCLDSVWASHVDGMPGGYEVIVVDDGSTDSSTDVVEEYMAGSPMPIRLVKKWFNTGVVDTRNLGLLLARAPFVFILDADNEIRPDCLLAHYQALADSPCAVAYGIINRFDHVTRQSVGTVSEGVWDVRKLTSYNYIDAMAMLRKETVLRVGGYSVEYGLLFPQSWEDYDLWLRLAQAGHTGAFIPRTLSDYRVHPDSMVHLSVPVQRQASAYFARKFFALAHAYPDTELLFAYPRKELATLLGETNLLPLKKSAPEEAPRLLHRVLGRKMLNSLNKRLVHAHHWLNK